MYKNSRTKKNKQNYFTSNKVLMQKLEVTIDPLNTAKTTKTRILISFSLVIPHTVGWWILESYSTSLYIFMMTGILLLLFVDYSEYKFPTKPKMLRAVSCGGLSAVLILMLPKFSFLAICCNFICFWTGLSILTKPQEFYYLIFSSLFGWASCYFYYEFWLPVAGYDDDTKYVRLFIEDSFYFNQLLLGIVICIIMSKVTLIEKDNQTKARMIYEEKLLTLNKNLEDANQKLFRTNQELEEALQDKENFILRFSHEIRNPLNSLLGNVDLCQEYAENKQLRQMLSEAKVSGEILLQLLNNILDTAKVSANRLDISMHYQDIRAFLERAWVVCSEIIRKKKLYGSLSLNANVPKKIEFDSHRLMQILINMVSNSSKFTDHGYVKVFIDFEEGVDIRTEDMKPRHVDSYKKVEDGDTLEDELNQDELTEYPHYKFESLTPFKKRFTEDRESHNRKCYTDVEEIQTKRRPDLMSKETPLNTARNQTNLIIQAPKEGYLRLEIVDTGCGIKKKDLDTLFTKFNQVNEQSSKRQIGTGLGLWITKEIVELMKGKIEIFSVPGHGTALVMMLKCKAGQHLPSSSQRRQSNALQTVTMAMAPGSIKRAMIVEDIPYNQEINLKFLQKCEVEEIALTSNGKEALDLYIKKGEEYFDLILMDIDMPIMDGKTATKKIRLYETENGWRPTPIVFLTAYSESKMQQELLDPDGVYKADAFLSKPTSQEIIRRTLTEQAVKLQERSRKTRSGLSQQKHRKLSAEISFEVRKPVLLIDDDPYNLSIVSRMLVKCGFKPLEASNAKQALELYNKHCRDINLVLTDCEMPIMDGLEVTQEIIKRHKKTQGGQNLVIYGITGYVHHIYKKKCLGAGMKDVLEKPITLDALRSLLFGSSE